MKHQGLAFGGQRHRSGCAGEQADTESILKLGDGVLTAPGVSSSSSAAIRSELLRPAASKLRNTERGVL